MNFSVSIRLALAALLLCMAGCWRSADAGRAAALKQACKSGQAAACTAAANPQTTIECQSGDVPACQKLASTKCAQGDRHVCQSLAVIYQELKPLCYGGNTEACAEMKTSWPDENWWRPEEEISAARAACKKGDAQSCQALGTVVEASGSRLIWLQTYVVPPPAPPTGAGSSRND